MTGRGLAEDWPRTGRELAENWPRARECEERAVSVEHLRPSVTAPRPTPTRPNGPTTWIMLALGSAYVVALGVLLFAPGGTFLERLRALDGGICAQLPGHSFYPAGEQLPLCARNTGIYLGFATTMSVFAATGRL